MEHVNAFQKHSRFKVWSINTQQEFLLSLTKFQFQIMVLHYSLFGNIEYMLSEPFLNYIEDCPASYKVAFFQDELRLCCQRFDFLNQHKVDCVYTLVEPTYFKEFYGKFTSVPKLINYIPGNVSEELIEIARRMTIPESERRIDIGYRARNLSFAWGKGAREKTDVATGFLERAKNLGLRLDIATGDDQRIYGDAWYEFIANCRAVLGVESGSSFTDIYDVAHPECERLIALNPNATFEEVFEKVLSKWEGNIPQRTISPRHFEAAAFRVTQILFEGKYSGIMQPLKHYIPLKKDFSNFDDCIRMFNDQAFCHEIRENAYRDLIASGRYSYRKLISSFDAELQKEGLQSAITSVEAYRVSYALKKERLLQKWRAWKKFVLYDMKLPGRKVLAFFGGPLLRAFRRWKQRRGRMTGSI